MALDIPPISNPQIPPVPTDAKAIPRPAAGPEVAAETPVDPISAPQESVDVKPIAGAATAPVVSLIDDTPDLKAHGEQLFASKLGSKSKAYLRPDDARLIGQLKGYHEALEKQPDMKKAIGRNPRGLDFMYTLEKAATGKKLTRDDIQSLQLFLIKDTRFGKSLAYEGDPEGQDGKFGVRTYGTLDHFMNHFSPQDLVPDAYYDRLDKEGVKYAKLE